jgi:uncharacterized RDD family membrane protein YckC
MICPVCKRDLAPTLSICFACGAMMNDTVREELETKVSPVAAKVSSGPLPAPAPVIATPVQQPTPPVMKAPRPSVPMPAASKPAPAKVQTSPLASRKTSPTLVGFQPKKVAVPGWRLELQNSVRQRTSGAKSEGGPVDAVGGTFQKQLITNGANALKPEIVEEPSALEHSNPKVANALKRIQESRKSFGPTETPAPTAPTPSRIYPFNVVSRSGEAPVPQNGTKPALSSQPKPKLVSSLRIEKKKYDTNKLPPLPEKARLSSSFDEPETIKALEPGEIVAKEKTRLPEIKEPVIENELAEPEIEMTETPEEIDDLAPLSLRFNAALFDLIIGGFAGLTALSPFMLSGGDWISLPGILAIAATIAVVTFVYLTVAIGFIGRTVGMRLFSLELIDAEENQYPTLHQAAVHSSLFILSLAFAGLGLLPIFFNEERRAAHDLLSGTILVREF